MVGILGTYCPHLHSNCQGRLCHPSKPRPTRSGWMDGRGRLCHCLVSLRLDSCQMDPHILGTSFSQDFFCSPTEFPLRCGLVKLPQALKMIVSSLLSLLPQAMLWLLCCGSVMSKASFHKITFKQKSFTRALYSFPKTRHIKVPVPVPHIPRLHPCSCSAKQAFLACGRG